MILQLARLRSHGIRFASIICLAATAAASAQTTVAIHDIMTNLPNSPQLGQTVQTTGVVVGVMSTGGFYLTSRDADWANSPSAAEGIPVFSSTVTACNSVAVGDVVTVTGLVQNLPATPENTPATGIQPGSCSKSGTAVVTKHIVLDAGRASSALATFGGALRYTGMPATDSAFSALQPTATTGGAFWGVVAVEPKTNKHLFRAAGISRDEIVPSGISSAVMASGANPQRILIDTTTFGGSALNLSVGDTLQCTAGSGITLGATGGGIGVIDYSLGYPRFLVFKSTVCQVINGAPASTLPQADASNFKVGTLDLNRFFNTTGTLTPVTPSVFATRLAKAALIIPSSFALPDVMAVQEVQDLSTLQQIGTAVNIAAGTSYTAELIQGNDNSPLNIGFLVNTKTVTVVDVEQAQNSKAATYSGGLLWQYPPLVLFATVANNGKPYPVTVINVHMLPRDNSGDPTLGADVRAHRAAQAAAISALVQQYQAGGGNVIVAGNFNSYDFNDGYVDVMGVIKGSPAAADAVALFQGTNTAAPLTDFTTGVASDTRYNTIENGNAASIEHILAGGSLASNLSTAVQPHFATDFDSATSASDPTKLAGLTPHDGFYASFALPAVVPATATISDSSRNFSNVYIPSSLTLQLTLKNTSTSAVNVSVNSMPISGANAGDFTASGCSTPLAMGNTCTISVIFSPTATGARSATLTVNTTGGTFPVTLSGTGVASVASLTPTSADFGGAVVGETSLKKVFFWANNSFVPLKISSINVNGDFIISATTCTTATPVAAHNSCTVDVSFKPTALKTRTGTLTITSNSSANGTVTVALTGTGYADVRASESPVNFGGVDVGRAATQTVTITNHTNDSVSLSGLAASGDYKAASNCGATLAGLGSCQAVVTFTPSATGARAGALAINVSDTALQKLVVPLAGSGADFSVALTPSSGNVIAGEAVVTTLSITPVGYNSEVSVICSSKALGSDCEASPETFILNGSRKLGVSIATTSKFTVVGYTGLLFDPAHRGLLATLMGLLAAGLLFAARRGKMAVRLLVGLLALALTSGAMSGCSGKLPAQNSSFTAPGTYAYTVTVTDGFLSHSATYSLKVTATAE